MYVMGSRSSSLLYFFTFVLVCGFGLQSCEAGEVSPLIPEVVQEPIIDPRAQLEPFALLEFADVFEPSGIVSLADGQVLVIEDEPRHAMSLLDFTGSEGVWRMPISSEHPVLLGPLEDLEGVARDDLGRLYVITSHSKTNKYRLPASRKKLIRFEMEGSNMVRSILVHNLKKEILKKFDHLRTGIAGKKADLNIEALSVRRKDGALMMGLRTPLIDHKALIISMENLDEVFDQGAKIQFSNELIELDLDGGGIRALAYDASLGGYLIISRREDKKNKAFKLWLWDGDAGHGAKRLRFKSTLDLERAEGIAPFRLGSLRGLLIVFDDGNRSRRKGGHYIFIPYDQLLIAGKNGMLTSPLVL
jgi:hypothetical protein